MACVDDGGGQQSNSPMAVLFVVPVKEAAAEVEAVVIADESVWEVGPVLEGLELAFGEGVVVADVGSAVRLGDAEGGQELGDGVGSHGRATVAVDRELLTLDAFLDERLSDQSFSQVLGFPVGEHPPDDVPAVDVEDHVEVVVGPLGGAEQLRDIPGPDLVRRRRHQSRRGISRMPELVTAFPHFLIVFKDAIHRADGAEIGALIEEFRVGFGWGFVGEWLTVEDGENLLAFVCGEGSGRCGPLGLGRGNLGFSVSIDRCSWHTDGSTCDGCADGWREFLDRFHGSFT